MIYRMAQWTYSDWIIQAADADRLTRLRLHIQEVSEYVLRTQAENFESELDRFYLPLLHKEERRIAPLVVGTSSSQYGGRNRARFSNV